MSLSTDPQRLRQVRRQLLDTGLCPPGLLDERVSQSWQRSHQSGLQPTGRLLESGPCTALELQQLSHRHSSLLAHSRPVMEFLFDQVRHQSAMVILSGPCGTLLHTLGDAHFLSRADRVALSTGTCWDETQRGTNAIGTALTDRQATQINGGEHYLERNGFLTCSAAPIVSATGELLGALDVSSEHRDGPGPVLGLVRTAAALIENRLLSANYRHHWRLHIHPMTEGLGSVGEGILVLSDDGWLVGANAAALKLLRLSPNQLSGLRLEDVLDVQLEDLLNRQFRHPDAPQTAYPRAGGRPLCVQLHQRSGVWHGATGQSRPTPRPTPSSTTPPASTPTQAADALARLDTGDSRWRLAADRARKVLHKPISLLVLGESGVGKELFARAAHDCGPRQGKPFVAINCASIPEGLIESELFGHTPGAFTGARKQGWHGLLREADGGTLFLDEIGDMPLGLQARLLRVLQDRTVTPVGGGKPVAVDFALVCATHQPLKHRVEQGLFRADLYYRINGLTVELPPLRQRTDVRALVLRILASHSSPDRSLPVTVAADLLDALCQHPWPGNLRQLSNALATACALMDDDEHRLDWHHLPEDLKTELQSPAPTESTPRGPRPTAAGASAQTTGSDVPANLRDVSTALVRKTVENCRGNVSLAARQLGISRQTIYRKLAAQ